MSKDILKKAAAAALEKELAALPGEEKLARQYTLSESFTSRMNSLMAQIERKYVNIFGNYIKREAVIYLLLLIYIGSVLLAYQYGYIERNSLRLFISTGTLIIIGLLSPKKPAGTDEKEEENFGRKYLNRHAPAMIDTSGVDPAPFPYGNRYAEKEMDYNVPVPPSGYSVKNEYRTASSHMVEYTDIYGRSLHFAKRALRSAVLVTVDIEKYAATEFTLSGCPAVKYSAEGKFHLLWEDKYYQYHMHGNCEESIITETAKKIPPETI